jgi:hypothetical protein
MIRNTTGEADHRRAQSHQQSPLVLTMQTLKETLGEGDRVEAVGHPGLRDSTAMTTKLRTPVAEEETLGLVSRPKHVSNDHRFKLTKCVHIYCINLHRKNLNRLVNVTQYFGWVCRCFDFYKCQDLVSVWIWSFLCTSSFSDESFEVFTAVMFQVEVFWAVTPCNVVVGYQPFRGQCYPHLQGEVTGSRSHITESVSQLARPSWLRARFLGFMVLYLLHKRLSGFVCRATSSLTGGRVCHVTGHSLCLCRIWNFFLFFLLLFLYYYYYYYYYYYLLGPTQPPI